MVTIIRYGLNVATNNFSLGSGGDFINLREAIIILLGLMNDVLRVLVIGGDLAVLLENGMLLWMLFAKVVAGVGLSVVGMHNGF